MWLLSAKGKRHLLTPGRKWTIGRNTQVIDGVISIDETSVSRKHLEISISPVASNDLENPDAKGVITIKDLNSRFGTTINSKSLADLDSRTIQVVEPTTIDIGPKFKAYLEWMPLNVHISTGEKGPKNLRMLQRAKEVLEPLGIKVMSHFTPQVNLFIKGTCVTSKLVYALVMNVRVTNFRFIERVREVQGSLSVDFDQNWPDWRLYVEDPRWLLNPERKQCFKGQNFAVYESDQLLSLESVIKTAQGSMRLLAQGQSPTLDEIVIKPNNLAYLQSIPGSKQIKLIDQPEILSSVENVTPVNFKLVDPHKVTKSFTMRKPSKINMMDYIAGVSRSSSEVKSESLAGQGPDSKPKAAKRNLLNLMDDSGSSDIPIIKAEEQSQVRPSSTSKPNRRRLLDLVDDSPEVTPTTTQTERPSKRRLLDLIDDTLPEPVSSSPALGSLKSQTRVETTSKQSTSAATEPPKVDEQADETQLNTSLDSPRPPRQAGQKNSRILDALSPACPSDKSVAEPHTAPTNPPFRSGMVSVKPLTTFRVGGPPKQRAKVENGDTRNFKGFRRKGTATVAPKSAKPVKLVSHKLEAAKPEIEKSEFSFSFT